MKNILDDKKYYMNPPTGTVQLGKDWKADQEDLDFPDSDLESLIEVEWNATHKDWEEV